MATVLTRHNITGHECEFPEDTVAAWRARGWIPVSDTPPPASIDAVSDSAADDAAAPTTSTKAAGRRASRNEE